MLGSSSSPFGQSSSSPFGSRSVFGQTCSASNNLFAPKPSGFGSQTGSSTPGGTSTGVFGAQTGSSVFGGTSTGVFVVQTGSGTSTGVFGSQTRSGTSTGVFGAHTGSSVFGGTSTGVFGTTQGSSPFPSSSNFSTTCIPSPSPFGVFGQKPVIGFGDPPLAFRQSSSTFSNSQFGAQSTIFGKTAAFMDQQGGGSMVAAPYVATSEADGGGKVVSISAMPVYKEKSHEELRWEDSEKLDSISAMPAYEEKSHEQIRWEYYHQLGDKGASSVFRQTSSPSISNPSSFAPASTSTTFKFNPTAPSAAPTAQDDGTSSQMGFTEAAPPSVSVPFPYLPFQNNYGQLPATQSPAAIQPVQLVPATNPFGTLPPVPQMSIGCHGTIQYGISSMPVVDKPAPVPVRVLHLLTSRHLTQRHIRLPSRNYNPKNDGPRIPFFI